MRKTFAFLLIVFFIASLFIVFTNEAKAQSPPAVTLTPSQTTVTQLNQNFTINIVISNVQSLFQWDANINWDPTILSMTSTPIEGDFMTQSGSISTTYIALQPHNGSVSDITDVITAATGVNGSGVLATLSFQVIGKSASTTISINNIVLVGYTPDQVNHPLGIDITPASTTATAAVSFVEGGAPAANAGSNQIVTQGSVVNLDGSSSITTGSSPTYTWSFTDGTAKTVTGKTATYTFNTPGIYNITLTLSDSNGSSNSTVLITVQSSSKPVAKIVIEGFTSGQKATLGQQITFNGSDSYEPNNGTIQRYLWDMGDHIGTGNNATITYAYHTTAQVDVIYNVTLTVFDATGLNATATVPITVGSGTSSTSPTPISSSGSTPTPTSAATPDPGSNPTPVVTPTPNNSLQPTGLPAPILAILTMVTITVFAGSTIWLRKRTC